MLSSISKNFEKCTRPRRGLPEVTEMNTLDIDTDSSSDQNVNFQFVKSIIETQTHAPFPLRQELLFCLFLSHQLY